MRIEEAVVTVLALGICLLAALAFVGLGAGRESSTPDASLLRFRTDTAAKVLAAVPDPLDVRQAQAYGDVVGMKIDHPVGDLQPYEPTVVESLLAVWPSYFDHENLEGLADDIGDYACVECPYDRYTIKRIARELHFSPEYQHLTTLMARSYGLEAGRHDHDMEGVCADTCPANGDVYVVAQRAMRAELKVLRMALLPRELVVCALHPANH